FSSAVGELGEDCGAEVNLECIPLKYAGLECWEIWVSEAQERMVLSVPPENVKEIMKIFAEEDVEAVIIGKFTDDKQLHLLYEGETVCELDMQFLHKGGPKITLKAEWKKPPKDSGQIKIKKENREGLTDTLKKLLAMPNIASKEWIIRQYDHEVQAKTILKPLGGVENDGPMDACVMKPLYDSFKGVAVANGINPVYGKIDPYWMAASNIDEALRNVVCVGGDIEQTALLDNFCWGDPRKSDQMAGLLRAAQACYDMAKIYQTPFISGKDSLNNEYVDAQGKKTSIPSTLLISAISIVPDIRKVVSMDIKKAGNLVYILGETFPELGGSHYYLLNGFLGNNLPRV
ncbi:phosphoribosylformylglycinamidine synthase, partial [bacterium]|nr:phosphoribosylformylglycinamidine synthase [bacterium]